MNDKVINLFPGQEPEEDATPQQIYDEANKNDVDRVIVIGLTKNKEFFVNGNIPVRDGIYLIQLANRQLLDFVME